MRGSPIPLTAVCLLSLGLLGPVACRGGFENDGSSTGASGSDSATSGVDTNDGGGGSDDGGSSGGGDDGSGGTGGTNGTGTTTGGGDTSGGGDGSCSDSCVAAAPGGWSGPVAVYEGAFADAAPACSGAYAISAVSRVGTPNEGQHDCVCTCDVENERCDDPVVGRYTEAGCTGPFNEGMRSWDGVVDQTCEHLPAGLPIGEQWTIGIQDDPELQGSCERTDEDNIDEVTWAVRMSACEPSEPLVQSGCNAGELCAPSPDTGFGDALCVYADGEDLPCPAGPYQNGTTYYQNADDTRACTPCGNCASTPSGSCDGTISVHVSDCPESGFATGELVLGSQTCDSFSTNHDQDLAIVADLTVNASCADPSGGEPEGRVTYNGAVTVCCM